LPSVETRKVAGQFKCLIPIESKNIHAKLPLHCLETGIESKDDPKLTRYFVACVRENGIAGSVFLPISAGKLPVVCIGCVSSTSLSLEISITQRFHGPTSVQEETCNQPDSFGVSCTVHSEGMLILYHLNRAIAITAILIASAPCALLAQAARINKASITQPEPGAVLVELFTSEGCSSCPPADALLRQINGRQTESGQLIVGISEHVTYWNQLGWSDPFSSNFYTERQYAYGQRFHLDSVYTPQMVINGEKQIVGSDRADLLRAIREEQKPQPISVHINAVSVHDRALAIDFSISGNVPSGGADLFAAVTDDSAKSGVTRGENSGRTLSHVSVARSITRIAKVSSQMEQTIQILLPGPSAASENQGRHLILFAQAPDLGRVLGVDTKAF
jgi:hypothetical protein